MEFVTLTAAEARLRDKRGKVGGIPDSLSDHELVSIPLEALAPSVSAETQTSNDVGQNDRQQQTENTDLEGSDG